MKKITINGVELELTQEQIESLKKTLEEKDYKGWKPKNGELYFYCSAEGLLHQTSNDLCGQDKWNISSGNALQSKHEAEMHKLRLQSMAERKWLTGKYFFWHFSENAVRVNTSWPTHSDYVDFFIGNMHSTHEEAEAWGKKYAEAWKTLIPKE